MTIADHPLRGLFFKGSPGGGSLFNSLVFNNSPDTDLISITTGNNLIGTDPWFADADSRDYRLGFGSLATDAGDQTPPGGLGPTDADGNPRVVGSSVDVGAYEFQDAISRLYFAQFGNGQGFTSDVVADNPSENLTVSGRVDFLDDDSLPLPVGIVAAIHGTAPLAIDPFASEITSSVEFSVPPLGALTISTDGLGSSTSVGAAVATSDSPLGGVIRFTIPGIGIAGVGASQSLTGFIVPVRRKAGGINTGIAVHNTEVQAVTLTLTLRTKDGQIVATTTIEDLAALGHLAKFINELFEEADTDDFEGTLVVEVTGGRVAATALELGTQPGQFTTLPVTPLQ